MIEDISQNKNNKMRPAQVSDGDYSVHFLIKITIIGILSFLFINLSNAGFLN